MHHRNIWMLQQNQEASNTSCSMVVQKKADLCNTDLMAMQGKLLSCNDKLLEKKAHGFVGYPGSNVRDYTEYNKHAGEAWNKKHFIITLTRIIQATK